MIGQGHYIGIAKFMSDLLTDQALNERECQYDGWTSASPLWLVTMLDQHDPRLVEPRKELISIFLEKGADANHLTTYTSFPDVEEYTTSTALCEAAKHGWTDIVLELIKYGANTTLGDEKPLIEATERLHEDVVKILLENGADPNMQDVYRHTAIEWAKYNEQDPVFSMLKEYGAVEPWL